ncbi:ABC transporter ATP-binding protein [Comamonadaceae bacterium]|nr:ABC transporter ATP-binding protein [Comamonadaceae bacterium]
MKPVAVAIENVALHFGATQVLRDINLNVEPGEFFALLGPSGSGKSTLLRLIAGFNRNQAGRVLIDGHDVSAVPPWQRNVGMVFQNYALWPHMTAAQNIAFGLEERRLPTADIKRRVAAVVELVELNGLEQRRPGQLSGGQQQRVAIARTLAIEPQLLLLDEPLSNLDAKLRLQTRQELKKLQRRLNITTLFVTHDQEEALTTCDRIAVLDQGVIQQVGTPLTLFDHPQNSFVSQFIGSTNLFAGQFLAGDTGPSFASPALGLVALPSVLVAPSEPSEMAFRPHAVRLCSAEQPPLAGHLQLSGVVHHQEFLGAFLRYEVRVGSALVLADQAHVRGQPSLPLGTAVSLLIPATEIRFMTL